MIDAELRRWIDPPLNQVARLLAHRLTANTVTICGFLIGLLAAPALAAGWYSTAAILIVLNRIGDGLDGAIARHQGPTDFGGYLDIVLDFVFYSAVIFGFVIGHPADAVAGAFLIFSFIGTGSSFLAFAAIAARRNLTTEIRGKKALYYLGGLTEGFETILLLLAICLFPAYFTPMAVLFGLLCWITTGTRIESARRAFG